MHFKKLIIVFSLLSVTLSFSAVSTQEQNTTTKVKQQEIEQLLLQKKSIDEKILDNNIWSKIYSNYHTYIVLKKQSVSLDAKIKRLEKMRKLTKKQEKQLEEYKRTQVTLASKLQVLKEYEKDPFEKFLAPPFIDKVPHIESPFSVIGAISYYEKIESDMEEYNSRYVSLSLILDKFKEKQILLRNILKLDPKNKLFIKENEDVSDQIKTFIPIIEIFQTSRNVHSKKIDEIKFNLKSDIQKEVERTMSIGAIILFFIFMLFLIKYLVHKYMSDHERYYMINKALNIGFVVFSIFTLLFAYIENISYLVTILGFASAGIAIAMKDWFMSLMGWLTILLGGSIHVGDRVKFVRDGVEYVGDIVDISMLRMTMHEDITLTSYMVNRRAGRMVFIPNNFIFTDMISNYSHAGLKTVWDGIDFIITFDSDAQKATQIAKEITKKYSKGYTEITRKQLNKLRSKYGMRNTNVEPRIFAHIESYGLKISAWYLTNSFATMTLRSTISIEIITRIQAEKNIQIAYPSQSIFIDKNTQGTQIMPDEILPSKEL
ncbi:MAG: mechanosensitive ion channel [Sulfurovum sp.]|nr:mechanosensitive ion channel [Sulfurovum sp.]